MKKKLLALLGAVASLALFAGCGEKECTHTYDNACDTTCNDCGKTRVVEDHVYDNACDTTCNVCGDVRTIEHTYDNACDGDCNVCGDERTPAAHVYDNACDASCNVCGDERTPAAHVYDDACDTDCNVCGDVRTTEHTYDNACDASCNVCGDERTPAAHVYDDACDTDCNVCGDERTIEHTYDNACDASCNVCGDERTPSDHVYDNACDADCNVCGDTRTPSAHVYDNACDADCNVCGDTRTPSAHVYDNACDADCNVCGDTRTPSAHVYDNACDTSCNVCGDTRETTHDFAVQTSYEATKFFFLGGEAALVAGTKAFATLGADKSYGYMPTMDVTVAFDEFTGYSMATSANIAYTFEMVDQGTYTIQAPDGRYLYMKGTYNSFNLAAELPAEGGEWTIQLNNATGEATITNVLTGKWIQYDSQYGTYGVYNSQKGTLPMIYCMIGVVYESDENGHWTNCSICGVAGESIPHSGGTANCTSPALCEYCNTAYGDIGDHTFEYGFINCDDTQHWVECDYCNAKKEGTIADHTYEYACSSACSLEGCRGTREPGAHVYDQVNFDETNHWNECVCGESDEASKTAHNDSWSSTTEGHVKGCSACDYIDESTRGVHTAVSDEWQVEEDIHYLLCACGWKINEAAHTYEKVSANGVDTMTCACGDSYTFNTAITAERVEFAVGATNAAIATTGASEYEEIVSIKLGNYDLGTNLGALVIGEDLAADKASHGEQNVIVTVKDAKGVEHDLEVPVTLITKGIKTDAEFNEIFTYTEAKAYLGYYVLMNDIGSANYAFNAQSRSTADCEWRAYGFCGTFDGNGYTITGNSASGGLFGWIGNGAVVRNFTVIDTAYNGNSHEMVLSRTTAVDALIEDITFKLEPAEGAATPVIKTVDAQAVGWLTSHYNINTKFKNITVDIQGYDVTALFGATSYCGFGATSTSGETPSFMPVTFENCVIKATNLKCLGYQVLRGTYNYITVESVIADGADITYYTVDEISEANEIKLNEESATLSLGDKYADATVVSIMYGTSNLGDDLTIPTSAFTTDDIGVQEFVITVKLGKVITEITVPVTISSGKTITTAALTDRQDVILDDITESDLKVSVDLGEYATAGNVVSATFGSYDLGNDVTNLDVTALAANPKDHGEGNIVVTIDKSETEELKLTIPVTVVTYAITSIHDFWGYRRKTPTEADTGTVTGTTVFLMNSETKNQIYGYYKVMNDIGYRNGGSDFEYVFFRNDGSTLAGAYENAAQGFCGTFDGNNKTIVMGSSSRGLFGSLANGAVVKDMKIVDIGYGNYAYATVFATSIWAATIENITIDVAYTSNSSLTTATHHVGYLAHMTSEGATYRNLTVTVKSSTYELVSLFGGCGWRGPKNNTFENCVINAKLGAIGHKGPDEKKGIELEIYSYEGVSGLTVNDPTAA